MLLAASGGFILSFLPFQRAFAEYRASNDVLTRHQRLTEALLGLEQIPDYMLGAQTATSRSGPLLPSR